jgi:hypothetical protein
MQDRFVIPGVIQEANIRGSRKPPRTLSLCSASRLKCHPDRKPNCVWYDTQKLAKSPRRNFSTKVLIAQQGDGLDCHVHLSALHSINYTDYARV